MELFLFAERQLFNQQQQQQNALFRSKSIYSYVKLNRTLL